MANETDGELTENVLLQKDCSPQICKVYDSKTLREYKHIELENTKCGMNCILGQPYCDNSIFESLSDLYQVKTKYGTYVKNPVLTQDEIDAGVTLPPIVEVYIEAGDIAEVSCANGKLTFLRKS